MDKENATINYLYVPEFEYVEEINYTFITEAEFDDLSSDYWGDYTLDTSMTADYAIRKAERR